MLTYKLLRLKQLVSAETSPVILLFSNFLKRQKYRSDDSNWVQDTHWPKPF
jgi:hypothetical protein